MEKPPLCEYSYRHTPPVQYPDRPYFPRNIDDFGYWRFEVETIISELKARLRRAGEDSIPLRISIKKCTPSFFLPISAFSGHVLRNPLIHVIDGQCYVCSSVYMHPYRLAALYVAYTYSMVSASCYKVCITCVQVMQLAFIHFCISCVQVMQTVHKMCTTYIKWNGCTFA